MLQAASRRASSLWASWLAHAQASLHAKGAEWAAAAGGEGSHWRSAVNSTQHGFPTSTSFLLHAPTALFASPLRSLSGVPAALQQQHKQQQQEGHTAQHDEAHADTHDLPKPSQYISSGIESASRSQICAQDALHLRMQPLQSAGPPQSHEQKRLQLLAAIRGCDNLADIASLLRDKSIPALEREHLLSITLALRVHLASQKRSKHGKGMVSAQALEDTLSALTWHMAHTSSRITVDVAQHLLHIVSNVQGPSRQQMAALMEAILNSLAEDNFARVHTHCDNNPRGFFHLSHLARTLCKAFRSSDSRGSSRPADGRTGAVGVGDLFREVMRAVASAASLHGQRVSQVWPLETLAVAPHTWIEFGERRKLAAMLLPVAMAQLPGYDAYSLALLMRSVALLNLFNFDAWKRKSITANAREKLLQQGVLPDAREPVMSQGGQVLGLEILHLLAAFHTRRTELSAKELCTLLWSLGSAAKVDTTVANLLAFQDDGHAAILTQAVTLQAAAMQNISQAAQSLRASGAGFGASSKLGCQEEIDLLNSVCPPGTWQWPPPPPPSLAPSAAPAHNFTTIMDDLTLELVHRMRSAPATASLELCHSISLSLWSLSHLRFYSKPLLDAIYEVCTPHLLAGASCQTLSQLAFSVCQMDGSAEQSKQVVRMCAQEFARHDTTHTEKHLREHSMLNLCWALSLADDPGPPNFRATVLKSLQQELGMQRWTGMRGSSTNACLLVHQLYSYLLVLQELEWEQAMRQQLQQEGQVAGSVRAEEASAPHHEALYLPNAPFQPPFVQAQAAWCPGGTADGGARHKHPFAVASRFSGWDLDSQSSSNSSSSSSSSSRGMFMPWDEPWLQQLLLKLSSITNNHFTKSSGFEKAVRSALVVMCGIEGYPWRLLRGGFSSDGHVSIDICLESVCGSVRASVEADGPYHFMINDTSRSNGSSQRRQRALRRRGILEVSVAAEIWDQWTSAQQAEKMHYLDHQLRTAVRREVDLLGGQQPAGWAPGTAERLLNTHLPSNEEVLGLQLARLSMPDPSIVARARAQVLGAIHNVLRLLHLMPPSLDIPAAHMFRPLHELYATQSRVNLDSGPRTWGLKDLQHALLALAHDFESQIPKQQLMGKHQKQQQAEADEGWQQQQQQQQVEVHEGSQHQHQQQQMEVHEESQKQQQQQQQQEQQEHQVKVHEGSLEANSSSSSSSSSSNRSSDDEGDEEVHVQGRGGVASQPPAAAAADADSPSCAVLGLELYYRFKSLSKVLEQVEERLSRYWRRSNGKKDQNISAGLKVELLEKLAAYNDAARRMQATEHRLYKFTTNQEFLEKIRAGKH